MARVFKSGAESYFYYTAAWLVQVLLRSLDPLHQYVLMGRASRALLEQLRKVMRAHADYRREF